jgi:hypothetical protein
LKIVNEQCGTRKDFQILSRLSIGDLYNRVKASCYHWLQLEIFESLRDRAWLVDYLKNESIKFGEILPRLKR